MDAQAREELFERAREYSTQPARRPEADALWARVVEAYRQAVAGGRVDRHDQRQLARALWRRGMLLTALGRHDEAREPGQEAIVVFAEVHQAVATEQPDPTEARRDGALSELITATVDAGESAFLAGHPAVRIQLIERALEIGLRVAGPPPGAGPRTREAMGTAYHNHATALLHRHLQQPSPGGSDAREAALAASRATELRQNALDPGKPITAWELANTYSTYAHTLVLTGDVNRARLVVELGSRLTDALGPAGAEIRRKLRAAADLIERSAGSGGDAPPSRWPWRRRR
ncbi:hypothetical protein KIF24_06560 [Micromonospora sp. Llam7]|uniref:hypothetical protein n=1 Tax=Micromonospora tarapacensis TaxID=2835305 RepID=UPI001C82FE79|nr:hypothetical protein [Micromonospora tarapacensis]MBX7265725.1 hypothetical protein [Micromonospora tarapacensis]